MRGSPAFWISASICIIILLSISGCIKLSDKDNEGLTHQDDDIPPIMLYMNNTEYGMTNISYKLLGTSIIDGETVYRFNISVKVEDPDHVVYHIDNHYKSYHTGGSYIMENDIENEYYFRDYIEHEWLDFWIMFYERGELIWHEQTQSYINSSVLKKVLSFSISLIDRNVPEDSNIDIYDMDWYFKSEDSDWLEFHFNISSSSEVDVEDIYFHNLLLSDDGKRVSSGSVFHVSGDEYKTAIHMSEEELNKMSMLLFSVGASNLDGRRTTTDVYWTDLIEEI